MLSFDEIKKKASQRNQSVSSEKNSGWEDIKASTRKNIALSNPYWENDVSNWFRGLEQIDQNIQKRRLGDSVGVDADTRKLIEKQLSNAGKIKSLISANREKCSDYQAATSNIDNAISYLSQLKNTFSGSVGQQQKPNLMAKLLQPETRVQQDNAKAIPSVVVENAEPHIKKLEQKNAYWQKYQGKTYDQINEILSSMEDGEEKTWLSAYATSSIGWLNPDAEVTAEQAAARKQRYEKNESRIAELDAIILDLERNFDDNGYYSNETLDDLTRYTSERDALKAENTRYKHIHEAEDGYFQYTEAEDFADATRDYTNPTLEDFQVYNTRVRGGITMDAEGTQRDVFGTVVDENYEDWLRSQKPVVSDKLGLFLSAGKDPIAEAYANGGDDLSGLAGIMIEGDTANWEKLKDTEIGIYYYLLEHEGQASAYKFLDDMTTELNRRATVEQAENIAEADGWEKVGLNLMSFPAQVLGGAVAFADDASNLVQGKDINPYSTGHGMQNFAQAVRSSTADDINEATGAKTSDFFTWGDAYQAIMSGVDSAFGVALGGSTYGILMGMGAASAEAKELYEAGASKEQLVSASLLAGAAEMVFEKYSIDKFADEILKKGTKSGLQLVRNALIQGGVEASEEVLTELANTITNSIVMGGQSDYQKYIQQFIDAGNSPEEAQRLANIEVAKNVGKAGVSGFLSGGAMGGVFSAGQLAQYKAEQQALQQLAEETVGDENPSLPTETNSMSIKEQLRNSQDVLNQMQPAAEIQIPKHFSQLDIAGKINWVLEKLRPTGYTVERKELGTIKFGRKQLKGAFNYFDKGSVEEAAFEALPYVLKNGIEISEHTNHKDREYGTVTIAAPVMIDSQRGNMAVVVKKTTENFYKVHRILTPDGAVFELSATENEAELTPAGELPKTGSLATPISSASMNSISQSMLGVNDEFSSLEGKTILVSEDREVSVKKFTGFSDGTATVKLDDGAEVAEKDIAFADEAENVLFHFLAREDGMTASAANAIWSLWQANKQSAAPVPAAKFRDSAFAVWRAGVRGDSTILNDKDSRAAALTAQQKEIIYETGRKAAQESTDAAQKNINAVYEQAEAVLQQKGKTSNRTYRATTAEGVRVQDMSPTQKASFLMAQRIAPAVKADIEVYDGGKEWGYYNPRTDKICLNINAKWDDETMLTFTLAHELLHRTKRGSPAQYKAFADFLVKKFGEQGADIEAMVAQQLEAADEFDKTVPENQRIRMTETMAFEEVVADACQRMLLDTDAGKRLAEFGAQSEQNRNFLKRFAKWLRELLENLRNAFADVTPDSLAAKEFAKFEENVKQTLADMFVEMNIDAGEKLSTIKEAGLTEKITTETGGVKYSLNKNAKSELHKALYDTKYRNDVLLRDETPAIMLAQKGVRNLPMAMKASHIRENVFSIEEAARLGLPTSKDINYHGLGEELFLKIIDGLDNVKEAYRGTKNADNPMRGENYFLLISEFTDSEGNVVNVPVYIDEHTQYNRVFIDINKISTVFGKRDIRDYIVRQIRNGNLVRIKNKSNLASERSAPIAEGYSKIASMDSIRNTEQNVNKNLKEPVGSPKKIPVKEYAADREMLVDMFEQMVTNSTEYKVLQDYKSHFYELSALEEAVEKLTAEIDKYSNSEGIKYTEKLKQLKLERQQAINRLNYYDGKLLGLEKSGVLKAMIDRSLLSTKEYYKQRNERREADIRSYYRESRRKAVERHDMAEVRQQIRKDVQRLDSLLNKGNRKKNVKLGLQEFVGSALRLAKGSFLTDYSEYDMIRSGLQNKLLPEEQAAFNRCRELLKELDKLQEEKNAEPGPDSIHEKWDPEQAIRREDRETALKRELAQNMRILRDGNVFQRERAGTEQATAEDLADELLRAYQKLAESEFEHLQGLYSQKMYEQIDTVKQFLSGKAIKDMTSVELKELRKLYRMVSEAVSRADELFGAHRNEKTSTRGNRILGQLKTDRDTDISVLVQKLKEFGWSLLTPEAAAAVIGSEELTQAIREIEATETVQAENLEHAKNYAAEQAKKYRRSQWDTSRQIEFAGTEITLGQAMSLYAYTERKAGRDHISGDGFVHSKEVPIKQRLGKLQISRKFIKDTTRAYRVTEDMYTELEKLLTEEQKGYARAMRDYLAEVMGAKGNEVSRELYGIEMYGEKFYFPLKSAKNFLDSALGAKRGEVKVTNQGFTHQLQEGASNAIVLEDFESVWAKHVQEMSNYHACGVAMENFNRLYNYRKTEQRGTTDKWGQFVTEEVKSSEPVSLHIERRAAGATGYLVKWMESVNGGVRSDATEKLLGGLLGSFRKTAVLGNLSVIVQQPTAILRAAPYLDKDFLAGWQTWKTTKTSEKGLAREMYRYCPVAFLKKMGGFDPSAGQTVRQYLFDGRDDGKGKLQKGLDKTNEWLGTLPEKADELAWSYLWLSCKKKTLRENKGLRAGSKEHCQAAAELFTQIVRETQVYDSVMSKPLIMQSKNMAVKGLTSFMNEPLKGLNQCITAVAKWKNGEISKSEAAKHILCVGASNLLASAVSCLIYALRDDDEEETYWEKYLKHFFGRLQDLINPFSSVPGIKEISSIVQGYGSERSEFAIISDAWSGLQKMFQESKAETPEELEKEVWDKLEKGLGNILNLTGIPARNLIREIRGIYYTIKRAGAAVATDAGTRYALQEGFTGKDVSKADQLYNAVVEDDGTHLTRVMSTWDNPKTAVSTLVSAVKDAYLDGKITDDRATEYLQEYGGKTMEQVSDYLSEWEFKKTYPDSNLKDSNAIKYIELAAPAGISLETYTQYVERTEGLTSEKDKDGDPIPGSKQKKVVAVINALPLTRKQKDVLHYAADYAESTVEDAPWNQ